MGLKLSIVTEESASGVSLFYSFVQLGPHNIILIRSGFTITIFVVTYVIGFVTLSVSRHLMSVKSG